MFTIYGKKFLKVKNLDCLQNTSVNKFCVSVELFNPLNCGNLISWSSRISETWKYFTLSCRTVCSGYLTSLNTLVVYSGISVSGCDDIIKVSHDVTWSQLDSTAFFRDLSFGANNDGVAIALMIAVMDTIGSLMRQVSNTVIWLAVSVYAIGLSTIWKYQQDVDVHVLPRSKWVWQWVWQCWCRKFKYFMFKCTYVSATNVLLISIVRSCEQALQLVWLHVPAMLLLDSCCLLWHINQQESWDYIGSSRMVYDIINHNFPHQVSA